MKLLEDCVLYDQTFYPRPLAGRPVKHLPRTALRTVRRDWVHTENRKLIPQRTVQDDTLVRRSRHKVTGLQRILTLSPLKSTIIASSDAEYPYIFRREPYNYAIRR
jgi:hypothetical protein